MKRFITILIGSSDDYSFEQRLYHGVCIIVSILLLGLTITNSINQLKFDLVICCLALFFTGILYYFARFKKIYQFFGLYALYVLFTATCYFNDNGIYGPMPYGIVVVLIFALAYCPIKWSIKIFTFHIVVFCAMLLIEHFLPQLITNPYKTQNILYTDLLESILAVIIFSFISIYYLRYSYEQEKEKVLEQKVLVEKANYQKTMFFINLSHEIKTPLTLIENYLEKYISIKGEDEALVIMRQNIEKIRRNMLDYLSFENLERGGFSFEKHEVFQFTQFLEEKILLFIPYVQNKNIGLVYIIEPDIYINVNTQGIDQVLNNLLENAVKYTPEFGKIKISLEKEKNRALLKIQNTGKAIPTDQIPQLFEPFYQLSHEKLNVQGVGMGLYIVKKIIDSIKGEITVSSSIEQGVVFSVILPLSVTSEPTMVPIPCKPIGLSTVVPNARDSAYSANRSSLLVVEDNNDLLCYLVNELSIKYNVFVASDGLNALERLENIPAPDLIISDIMMDKMDGYQLLEKTITDKRFAHIPFIFLTAKSDLKEKLASLEMGALDFISKPFSTTDLKVKIKAIIEQKERISKAVIQDLKKQFTDNHFLKIKQRNEEAFITNALKYKLTQREKEVVKHMQKGLKYDEIGKILFISEHTVVRHVQNIYEKTGSSSKIDLLQKMFINEESIA